MTSLRDTDIGQGDLGSVSPEIERRAVDGILEDVHAKATRAGELFDVVSVRWADTRAVAAAANDLRPTLIVTGSRGPDPSREAILGSMAYSLLHDQHYSALLVRAG